VSISSRLSSPQEKQVSQPSPIEILKEKARPPGKGVSVPYLIYAVAKLGIADLLKNGPMTNETLASTLKVYSRALLRTMEILADEGIFVEVEEGKFASNPVSQLLESGKMRERVIVWFEKDLPVARDILYTITTGEPAFEHVHGMGFYEYCSQNADFNHDFDSMMTDYTRKFANEFVPSYDFSDYKVIVDVGGSVGMLLAAILKANPHTRGKLFDRLAAIEEAGKFLRQEGVLDRCELVPGSYFDSAPPGADLYILKWVLPDLVDETFLRVMRNIRKGMNANSKLLLVDTVMPRGNKPSPARHLDLNMMIIGSRGGIRSESEIRDLSSRAGLSVRKAIPITPLFTVFELYPT